MTTEAWAQCDEDSIYEPAASRCDVLCAPGAEWPRVNLTGEDLATAICCDARTRPYAEPQFFFQRPEIDLSPAAMEPTEGGRKCLWPTIL